MNYDLIIIGASFAGLSCARAAVSAGLNVAVIEKKSSSGAKLHTTGVIVKDAIEANPWLQTIPSELTRVVEGVRLYAPKLNYIDLYAPGYYFWATETPALLDWMANDLAKMGVTLHHQTVFESAMRESDGWIIKTKSGQNELIFKTAYLVGADGPHSRVAKALGLSANTQFLFGQEHEYAQASLSPDVLHCFIDRQLARGYLGWALAGVNLNQIGLARRYHPQNPDARRLDFEAFLHKISPHIQIDSTQPDAVRAGMIPCGGVLPRISTSRAILVGDAAGMVSPVTAGGIHTALQHGEAVGLKVAEFLNHRSTHAIDPANELIANYPNYRIKRFLRWGYDHFQRDWMFDLMLHSKTLKRFAEQIYFHKRGTN